MATNWRVYGADTIAAVLDKSELPSFWRRITVGPNEAALVIRNGKIEDVITESRVGTSGFRDRVAALFGKAADVQVVFVDTSPFELTFFLGEATRGEGSEASRSGDASSGGAAYSAGITETRDDVYNTLESRSHIQTDTASVVIQALTADRTADRP